MERMTEISWPWRVIDDWERLRVGSSDGNSDGGRWHWPDSLYSYTTPPPWRNKVFRSKMKSEMFWGILSIRWNRKSWGINLKKGHFCDAIDKKKEKRQKAFILLQTLAHCYKIMSEIKSVWRETCISYLRLKGGFLLLTKLYWTCAHCPLFVVKDQICFYVGVCQKYYFGKRVSFFFWMELLSKLLLCVLFCLHGWKTDKERLRHWLTKVD